jgi:roadblock/LC7 domain-containing protein
MSYPFIIQGNNIVVVIGNKSHTISKTHITYNKVLEAIKAQDWDTVKDIIEPKKVVLNYGAGNISIQGETLYWKGEVLNTGLARRMIEMLQEGFPIEPMVNFMENLYANPSKRAVTELYSFLEKNNLPITPDGHFLAYKKVRDNFMDVHSGTMLNAPGQTLEMERNAVDDNKDNTCSTGLHFCGMSYLSCFGGDRTVIVKINPRDVVSIPSDYNDAKGRTCRYEVIGELGVEPEEAFTAPVQENANTSFIQSGGEWPLGGSPNGV